MEMSQNVFILSHATEHWGYCSPKFMYLHISDYLFTFCISISLMLLSNVIQISTVALYWPCASLCDTFVPYFFNMYGGKGVKNSEVCPKLSWYGHEITLWVTWRNFGSEILIPIEKHKSFLRSHSFSWVHEKINQNEYIYRKLMRNWLSTKWMSVNHRIWYTVRNFALSLWILKKNFQ